MDDSNKTYDSRAVARRLEMSTDALKRAISSGFLPKPEFCPDGMFAVWKYTAEWVSAARGVLVKSGTFPKRRLTRRASRRHPPLIVPYFFPPAENDPNSDLPESPANPALPTPAPIEETPLATRDGNL